MIKEKSREAIVEHDALNEQIVVAAGLVDPVARKQLLRRIPPDRFFAKEHVEIWTALAELDRTLLTYDHATLVKLSGGKVPIDYLVGLVDARPSLPVNLEFHVAALLWDNARLSAVEGPISSMLDAVKDPRSPPEKVRALARQVSVAFDGYEERKFLLDPYELVRSQTEVIRGRAAGRAIYTFSGGNKSPGLAALDTYEKEHDDKAGQPRLVPGPAPGMVTVITGVSGAGKTTITSNLVIGLARQKRRVLYGAWEVNGGMTLEVLACISLKWSRSLLLAGRRPDPGAPKVNGIPEPIDEERVKIISDQMERISEYVRFLANPFQRGRSEKKRSNDYNLDLLHGYIADSAADVFVGDLWERCLVFSRDESDERQALFRQQAMAEETKCHCILLAQQRLKDIEQRSDKRPTREGIKGSSAWVDIADTIIGIHNPGLWKEGAGDVVEIDILKQRYGRWPQAIEFDWNGDRGTIENGRSVPYTQPTETSDGFDDFAKPKRGGGGRRR